MSEKKTIEGKSLSREDQENLLLFKIEKLEEQLFKKEARIAELEKIIKE